jgi:rSAM/selenodomain-associated transferase 1
MPRRAVVIVAKQPEPGKVKTRLCPHLSPQEAAALAEAFLRDTINTVSRVPDCDLIIGYSPHTASDWFRDLIPPALLIPQGDGDLGERMNRLTEEVFKRGYDQILLIGTDTPHLTSERIEEAFVLLSPDNVIIGPSEDGGYYLIGLSELHPALFENIEWSTDRVFSQTIERAAASGLSVKFLPPERDIDTPADLAWLKDSIQHFPHAEFTAALLHSHTIRNSAASGHAENS